MKFKSVTLLEASKDVLAILDDGLDTAKVYPVSPKNKIRLTGVKLTDTGAIELLYNGSCNSDREIDRSMLQVMANQDLIADLYNQLAAGGGTGGTGGTTDPIIGNFANVSGPEDSLPVIDQATDEQGTFTYVGGI